MTVGSLCNFLNGNISIRLFLNKPIDIEQAVAIVNAQKV